MLITEFIQKKSNQYFKKRINHYSQCFFILGTGRSGTSLLAKLAQKAGIYIGEKFLKPTEFNPQGYYEDKRIIKINRNLLRANRAEFLGNYPSRFHGYNLKDKFLIFVSEIKIGLLLEKFSQYEKFGFKNPQTILTLPVWAKFLKRKNIKILAIFRQPISVAKSFYKMGYVNFLQNIKFWTDYNLLILNHLSEYGGLLLKYEDLISEQKQAIDVLSKFISLDAKIIHQSIEKKLNRSQSLISIPLPQETQKVLEALEREKNKII